MLELRSWCWVLGMPLVLHGVALMACPGPLARAWRGLPRSVWAGRLLATAALAWAGWVVYAEPLEFLLRFRNWLPFVFLAAIPLSWAAMPDLLSCRAMGGLLALLPAPVLLAARLHPSPWRLVIVVLMYLSVVKGMALMMSPYLMRRAFDWLGDRLSLWRACGAASLLVGGLLVVLGATVLR